MTQVLEKMNELGIKQVDLIPELRKRGLVVQPPALSSILKGTYTYPKAQQILEECERIVAEFKSE